MLTFQLNLLPQLSSQALYNIFKARCEVFVVEQHCAYPEIDDTDLVCWHLQGFIDNSLACYARIIPPDYHDLSYVAIGRVLTVGEFRGHHYGRDLMQKAIEICQQYYPSQPIFIAAQTYLIHFYQALGFCIQGDCYLEDGIEHVNMIWEVKHDA